jgi:hypothetical protein
LIKKRNKKNQARPADAVGRGCESKGSRLSGQVKFST